MNVDDTHTLGATGGDYPDGMDADLIERLRMDELVYGQSYAEKTEGGWRRIAPTDAFVMVWDGD